MRAGNQGTNQDQRLNKNLLDDLVRIDDRSSEELLGYLYTYSKYLNFYNSDNQKDGHWNELLKNDPIIYISYIITYPVSELDNENLSLQDLQKWSKLLHDWSVGLSSLNIEFLTGKIKSLVDNALSTQEKFYKSTISSMQSLQESKPLLEMVPPPAKKSTDPTFKDTVLTFKKTVMKLQGIAREYLKANLYTKHDHSPDAALYITFVLLYRNVQKSINTIPKRHLDFYYKDVLQLSKKTGVPTKSIVTFQPAPTVVAYVLEKGTRLSAGKLFNSSEEVLFETQKGVNVYPVELANLQTLYFNKSPYIKAGTDVPIVSNVVLNKLMSNAQGVFKANTSIPPAVFGADPDTRMNVGIDPGTIATFGFYIGSPVLFLSEGKRVVDVQFSLDPGTARKILWNLLDQIEKNTSKSSDKAFADIFDSAFLISYTTAKGWSRVRIYEADYDRQANLFSVKFELGNSDPAVDILNAESAQFKWPSLKFELNSNATYYAYSFLSGVIINSINLNVHVTGIKSLSVYSNASKVSLAKPFEIFGPQPLKGSYVMIGHSEFFKKKPDQLIVHINWQSLPSDYGGFDTYYDGYSESFTNDSFKVQTGVLSEGKWLPEGTTDSVPADLFRVEAFITPEGYESTRLVLETAIEFPAVDLSDISRNYDLSDPLKYTIASQAGFFKLTLVAPSSGFGDQVYRDDFATIAMYNAQNKTQVPYPRKPFVPMVDSLSVEYKASDVLDLTKGAGSMEDTYGSYFIQLTPLGIKNIWNDPLGSEFYLIPPFNSDGYLQFNLHVASDFPTVSLYFYFLRSGLADTHMPGLKWEYFKGEHWFELNNRNIISDGTNGFIKSGIVVLQLVDIDVCEPGVYCIRVSPRGRSELFPTLGGIFPNAAEVRCISEDENVIGKAVNAGTITKLVGKFPEIKSVAQPVASYDGNEPEGERVFYTRVSERIRHNSRAVTIWDYERLILERFNEIRIVKCTNLNEQFKQEPGRVTIAVLSREWSVENPVYMSLNELSGIQDFIKKRANSFVTIQVRNPQIENLIVNCFVEFNSNDGTGGDVGLYLSEINREIIHFISPLSTYDKTVAGIGGYLTPQVLCNYLMNLPYVKSIKKLYIEHIVQKGLNSYSMGVYEGQNTIYASTPWSVLLSVSHNNIVFCEEDDPAEESSSVAIGNMAIGLDFILQPQHTPDTEDQESTDHPETGKHHEHKYDSILVFNKKIKNE